MSDWCPENDGAYRAEMAAMYPVANRKRIAELEAERDELTERVDELQQACEVVSSEFEGELWQSCRRLLQKTQFDFHGADVDGIQADAFESHMNETLVEFDHAIARIAELEAKLNWVLTERDETFALMLDRVRTAEAKLASWQAAQHYSYIGIDGKQVRAVDLENRAIEAEAKLAKAVVGLNAMFPAAQQMSNPKMENTIRATLKELSSVSYAKTKGTN